MTQYVVGLGEVLWDLLPAGRQLGGAPANFAWHVHALGLPSVVVSAVGADEPGDAIRQRLADWGIDTRYLQTVADLPTGTVSVTLDASGVPQYVIHENVAWDHIVWQTELEALAAQTCAVCFGTLGQRHPVSRGTIQRFLASVPVHCLRVCDVNLRQSYYDRDLLRASLEAAQVLKLNHEELPVIASVLSMEETGEDLLKALLVRFSLRLIALTRGARGSLLLTADQTSDHPGYPVPVVDTVGAGDAFTAVLVAGVLQGHPLDVINEEANRRAAQVCTHAGATA
ncbi:MAG: carbohydrate kinase [Chloroherpetonaceae bacterium]|nr:carbohydrate kinase [Chthonomonadaceae bacterium]MDW8209251.1 carbohydrate kinase [Chloroherpetonaceae bacterium]